MKTCDYCDRKGEGVCENLGQAKTCDHGWPIRLSTIYITQDEVYPKNTDDASRAIEPDHYKQFKIEPLVFCAENALDVFQTNIIKYTCRHAQKNGVEDIRKAINYAFKYIAFLEGDPNWIKVGTPKLARD